MIYNKHINERQQAEKTNELMIVFMLRELLLPGNVELKRSARKKEQKGGNRNV